MYRETYTSCPNVQVNFLMIWSQGEAPNSGELQYQRPKQNIDAFT